MEKEPRLRVLVVDPDPSRRERLARFLSKVPVAAVADWKSTEEIVRQEPPSLVLMASEIVGRPAPLGSASLPLELPEPVIKVVILHEGEGLTPEFLASGFHAVLYDPVTLIELDRVLALAGAVLEHAADSQRRRLQLMEALRQLEVEVLALADATPNWLGRSLELMRRLLGVPALALWELVEGPDQLRCLGSVGLAAEYVAGIQQGSLGRGQEILDLLVQAPLRPIELHPASPDPRVVSPVDVRRELGLRHAITIPLRERARICGFMAVYFSEHAPFSAEDLPLYDAAAGMLAAALAVSRARRQLVVSQRRLSELIEGLHVGVVVCDLDGTILLANRAAARMIAVPNGSLVGLSLPAIVRTRTELPWEMWRQLAPGTTSETLVVQAITPDHRLREIECRVQAIELPDERVGGWVPRLQFLLQDVTLERRRLLELELLQDLTRMVTDHRDLDAAFRMVAERLQRDLGYALVGLAILSPDRQRFIGQAIRAEGAISFNEWLTTRGVTGRALRENRPQLVVNVREDPDYFEPLPGLAVESEIVVLLRRWGEPIGVLNIESRAGHRLDEEDLRLAENVAVHLELLMEQVELTDRLSRQALTDPLTGLANRRALIDRLQHVTRDRRVETAAVLLIDFDGFKQLNDQRGHLFGDAVLQQVANRLAQHTRPDDLVARYAGDEFAVVLVDVGLPEAYEVAERLRRAVAREPVVHEDVAVNLTISIGLAVYPDHGRTPDELIRVADEAMYRAKRRGGNGIALVGELG
ncbi:Response regulator PleD [bacterium HR26]|nr:Response regulator PleD [bacterium HR26]